MRSASRLVGPESRGEGGLVESLNGQAFGAAALALHDAHTRFRHPTTLGHKGAQRLIGGAFYRRRFELNLGFAIVPTHQLRLLGAGLAIHRDFGGHGMVPERGNEVPPADQHYARRKLYYNTSVCCSLPKNYLGFKSRHQANFNARHLSSPKTPGGARSRVALELLRILLHSKEGRLRHSSRPKEANGEEMLELRARKKLQSLLDKKDEK